MCYVKILFVPSQSVLVSWSGGCVVVPSGVGKSSDVLGPPFVSEVSRSFNILQIEKHKTNLSTDLDQVCNFSSHVFPQLVRQYLTEKKNMVFYLLYSRTSLAGLQGLPSSGPKRPFQFYLQLCPFGNPVWCHGAWLTFLTGAQCGLLDLLEGFRLALLSVWKTTVQSLLTIYHFIQKLLTHIHTVSLTRRYKINEH